MDTIQARRSGARRRTKRL